MLTIVPNRQNRWPEIGRQVIAARNARGWTRAELCRRAGVSEPVVRKIEQGQEGERRGDSLGKIARALGWSTDAFDRMLRGAKVADLAPDSGVIAAIEADPGLDDFGRRLLILTYREVVSRD